MNVRMTGLALGLALGVAGPASAGVVTLTGIADYDIATVFRPLFPSFPDRSAVIDQARFQVNGDMTGTTGTLGIFTVYDIDGASLRPAGGAASIEDITFNLFPAVNSLTGSGGITSAGDLSIYFTTNNANVLDPNSGIVFDNGGGTDPTGLGNQFENLTLVSSGFQQEGIYDISRSIDVDPIEAWLLEAINNGDNIRFIIASQTGGFTSNFGTGNVDQSPTFDFFGEPPTVSFAVTAIPAPGALALLAMFGMTSRRRRD